MIDKDPQDAEIIAAIGADALDPQELIDALLKKYEMSNVIEALQRAIERGKISLNSYGNVMVVQQLAAA